MIKFLICLSCITSALFSQQYKYDLCVCAIFQNEARFLKEWIEFHEKQGVQHFYLYNNNSVDDYHAVIDPFVAKGMVTLKEWSFTYNNIEEWNAIQCSAYIDAVEKMRTMTKWCAFLDTDEFLFNPNGKSLRTVLKLYNKYPGVIAHWVMYGTSGIEESNCLTCDLVMRSKLDYLANRLFKTICKPAQVIACPIPHIFFYKNGKLSVNENKISIHDCENVNHCSSKLRINHYWVRDEKFLREHKQLRRARWYGAQISKEQLEELNAEFDFSILDALH